MGMYEQKKCIFTGLDTYPIIDSRDAVEYRIKIGDKVHMIRLTPYLNELVDDPFFKQNKNKFYGLLFNDDWLDNENTFINIEVLKKLIKDKYFPKTPKEKQDALFLKLASYQKQDGYVASIDISVYKNDFWKLLYFNSASEMNFYFNHLNKINLISANYNDPDTNNTIWPKDYYITINGLNELINLQESGQNSNKCFVAMAFKDKTIEIREVIKEALIDTGFEPILIDEQNIESSRTINDEIIANLKKCKFCIADFSYHSNGVYFESGFALGQGKKVIYTCLENEFSDAHFDIRPLQHIIYKDATDLKKRLKLKIEAWIL
jgi:hypothetical protein